MNSSELSIIIVNWNGMNFLPACLKSIVGNPPSVPYEIVIVDNASSDGSEEWLRSDEPTRLLGHQRFVLIESGENLGFGRGINLGIDSTTSPNVFILNPDTLITAGALDRLLETLRSRPEIGMVGPKIINPDGTLQASVLRQPETPASIVIEGLQLYRILPRRLIAEWLLGNHWNHDERRPVPVIGGAAMMCRREMIAEVGGFDPSIHMYSEEFEWCVRARQKGWKLFFEPQAAIVHFRGKSTEQRWTTEERIIVVERATIFYENKSFPKILNLANGLTRVIVLSLHRLRWRLQGKDTRLFRRLQSIHIENCRHLLSSSNDLGNV